MRKITIVLVCLVIGIFTASSQSSFTEKFVYDQAGRLIEAMYGDSLKFTFEYDLSGNMTKRSVVNTTSTSRKEHIQQTNWKVYPNPFQADIFLSTEGQVQNTSVQLYDLSGRMLLVENIKNLTEYSLSTEYLISGAYLLKIIDVNRSEIHKIIKF